MYDKLINTCYIYIIQLSRYIKNESETLNLNDIYDCLNSIIPQFHTYSQRGEFERERETYNAWWWLLSLLVEGGTKRSSRLQFLLIFKGIKNFR